jgi:hypothetical protein
MTLLPATEQAIDSPANALRAEDAAWLRRRIALVRSDLDDLVKSIYWTDGLGRSCDHLKEEAQPTFEVATVAVVAVIGERREELRDQVTVCGVDLDEIAAGVGRAAARAWR